MTQEQTKTYQPNSSLARRYTNSFTRPQGPLAGAFLKDIPMNGKTFWNSEWTALSRFRFGIPLSLAQGLLDGAKWGDEAVDKHGYFSLQRHDRVRDALARSLRGIRAFCAHTECRLGTSNLYSHPAPDRRPRTCASSRYRRVATSTTAL